MSTSERHFADDYPVRLDGRLDPATSRWQWLLKWLLIVPHVVVLTLLWAAVLVVSVVAWFAIVLTGRYPRTLFDFVVGVLRWTWRVVFYASGAFATDRYPPFTLRDVAEYPARLDVPYPARLSRGLVLVKSWLLAIPHLAVVGILAGGWGLGWDTTRGASGGGLIALLAVIAAVVLLVTGRYPPALFDLVVGLDRWAFRVLAYVLLLRDEYPPFRLDLGGADPQSYPERRTPTPPVPGTPTRWTTA